MYAVLYLMPKLTVIETPMIDRLARQMAWAIENRIKRAVFAKQYCDEEVMLRDNVRVVHACTNGFHTCTCRKANSSNADVILPGGTIITNTLAVHYLVLHRSEIPDEILTFLERQADLHGWREIDVTEDHLNGFCFSI